jgi:hypothetical protein
MAHDPTLVEARLDTTLEPGTFRIGGVRVIPEPESAEEFWRAFRTRVVACASHTDAESLRELVEANPELEWVET